MSAPTDRTNQDMTDPSASTRPENHGNASPQSQPVDQEALLRAFLHHSPAAIAMLDRELRYILVSKRWLTVCGLETLNVVGKNYYEVSPETSREWREIHRRALSGETIRRAEDQIMLADGRTNWVEWEVVPWYDSDGSIGGIIIFMEVITERKLQAEELQRTRDALELDEARAEALLQLHQMSGASIQEITDFALESAVKLTGSQVGYLSFVNEDETLLTMHSWSDLAQRECKVSDQRLLYPVETTGLWGEAIRQRAPIITNDYNAPSPMKKGYPEGHVPIIRHMNAPIFDGAKIVAVAGVANKLADYNESDVRQLTLIMQAMWRLLQRKWSDEALAASAERYRTLVANIPDVTWTCDATGKTVYASPNIEEVLGCSQRQAYDSEGMVCLELVHPEDRAHVEQAFKRLFESDEGFDIEYRALTNDGQWIWVHSRALSTYVRNGTRYADGVISNITRRKRAEEEVRSHEALLRALVDNLPFDFWAIGTDARYIADNATAREHWGGLVGNRPEEMEIPDDTKAIWLDNNRRALSGEIVQGEVEYPVGDEMRTFYNILAPIRDGEEIRGAVGINIDITERKRAETALMESEEKFRELFNNANDAIVLVSLSDEGIPDGIIEANDIAVRRLGYSRDELLAMSLMELAEPERRDELQEIYHSLTKQKRRTFEWTHVTKDGRRVPVEISAHVFKFRGQNVALSIARDIAERKAVETALRQSEEKFRGIFENSGLGIFQSTIDGRILSINLSYARILGYDSVEEAISAIHDVAEDIYVQSTRRAEIVREILSKEGMSRYENQYKKKDGSVITCTLYVRAVRDETGKVAYVEGFLEDITERKIAEQRQKELDAHKREFYRRTILAATEGKLEIAEPGEIEKLAGPVIATWRIELGEDLSAVRRAVTEVAEREGMAESRIYDLALCVGELTTNAFKHAGGGVASLHEAEDRLIFVTSDRGPGMEALTLPEVALKRGFSTARSLGMGYKAVISIADKVYLATGPTGTTVAIEMRIHPSPRTLADLGLPDTWD